jgi:type I restriction enzyme M protein
MNLLLHGLEYPRIDPLNSLRFPLREIGDKDRVDIILTNPPFGGEEERGILGNFPEDKQTAETALLFLQLIMRKLRRPKQTLLRGGRAAVVVPDGILSQEGVAARIREELVTNYNLHTIVRLPRGVFEPYTKINTNILFFDTNLSEENVWYYEVKVRSDVKAYTQHRSLLFEELEPCISWWTHRSENEYAWKVSNKDIARNKFSLDFKNPNKTSGFRYTAPKFLIEEISSSLQTILEKRDKFASLIEHLDFDTNRQRCDFELFGKLTEHVRRPEQVLPDRKYPVLAMAWYAKGLSIKYEKEGSEIKANILYRVEKGDFVYNRLFAWKGAFALVKEDTHNCYVSNEFPCFKIVDDRLVPGFLWCYFAQPMIWDYIEGLSSGTTSTSRLRLKENRLRQFKIPLPPKPFQEELAKIWEDSIHLEVTITRLSNILGDIGRAIFERSIPFRF